MLSTHIFPNLQATVFGHVQGYRNAVVLAILSVIPLILLHLVCFHIFHKSLVNKIHALFNHNEAQSADAEFKQTGIDKAILISFVWIPFVLWSVVLLNYQVPVLKVANKFVDYIIVPGLDIND